MAPSDLCTAAGLGLPVIAQVRPDAARAVEPFLFIGKGLLAGRDQVVLTKGGTQLNQGQPNSAGPMPVAQQIGFCGCVLSEPVGIACVGSHLRCGVPRQSLAVFHGLREDFVTPPQQWFFNEVCAKDILQCNDRRDGSRNAQHNVENTSPVCFGFQRLRNDVFAAGDQRILSGHLPDHDGCVADPDMAGVERKRDRGRTIAIARERMIDRPLCCLLDDRIARSLPKMRQKQRDACGPVINARTERAIARHCRTQKHIIRRAKPVAACAVPDGIPGQHLANLQCHLFQVFVGHAAILSRMAERL